MFPAVLFIFSIGFANQEIPPSLRVLKLAPHKTEIPVISKTCLNINEELNIQNYSSGPVTDADLEISELIKNRLKTTKFLVQQN